MLASVEKGQVHAASVPHRERYLLLDHRLAKRVLDAHLQWADGVEAELG